MSDLSTLRARVEAAQKLAAKATPGPWHAAGDCQTGGLDYVHVEVPIQPEQSVSEAILATIQMYGAHKAEAAGNANLMAAAPDLVTLATDLLAEVDRARLSASCAGFDLTAIGAACDIRDNEYPLQAVQRVVNQLNAIRAALGNGADEAAWPPGLTVAEVVGRLRGEHHSLRDVLQWVNDQCPGKCSAVCDSALRASHEGPHAEALGAGDGGGDGGGR